MKSRHPRSEDPLPVPFPGSYWLVEGQFLAGEYPAHPNDDRAREKLESLLEAGIRTFIDLTQTDDPLDPYEDLLREAAAARGVEVRYERLPIRDMDVPTSERMTEILSLIQEEMTSGRAVYVHCWGGLGRTGTVAACWLVEQGYDCDGAFARIDELRAATPDARRDSPQTDAQRDFARGWGERK